MDHRIQANRRFLTDLFAGPFRGQAIIMDPTPPTAPADGDYACTPLPLERWLDYHLAYYEARLRWSEGTQDDSVPHVRLHTGTHLFAAAFGCGVHIHEGSPASARPLVRTAAEADRLLEPTLSHPVFEKTFELARQLRRRVGPEVSIAVPDIQSPFDIAALIWNKVDFYVALCDAPEAVERLVSKCHHLLETFLVEFRRIVGECNYCHCPYCWAPPELGCWLSEDEVGSMSTTMFERFCLPVLNDLSRRFGGIFVHCCATADHQYGGFRKIVNLRGLNRAFQAPGPRPAFEAFTPQTVMMVAWTNEQQTCDMLKLTLPQTRLLLNMPAQELDESRRTFQRMRALCPRQEA